VTMAQAVEQGQGAPRRRLPWILLALSVALNLFFIGGAVWIRMHPPPPGGFEARFRQMPAELALDPQQKAAFDRYARHLRGRIGELHAAIEPVMGQIWTEIAKPEADEASVAALFDKIGAERRSFQSDLTQSTLAFLATLSPDQRAKFVAIMERPPRGWGHRRPPGASR
jgi:uncharacterized membrane protein